MALRPGDVLAAVTAGLVALGSGAWYLPLGIGAGVGVALVVVLACFRRLRTRQEAITWDLLAAQRRHYRQSEALFSLFALIRPRAPLPQLRDWAISPDFALLLLTEIRARRPRLVLELGSGASTVLIGYALEGLGSGRVVSVDHEPTYARRTEGLILAHGLEGVATVRTAPLAAIDVEGQVFSWYRRDTCLGLGVVDLLIVDGPPGSLGSQARYPAFPVLKAILAPDAVIVVDDGVREDEAAIVKRWQELDPRLIVEYTETEKGAYVLRRSP